MNLFSWTFRLHVCVPLVNRLKIRQARKMYGFNNEKDSAFYFISIQNTSAYLINTYFLAGLSVMNIWFLSGKYEHLRKSMVSLDRPSLCTWSQYMALLNWGEWGQIRIWHQLHNKILLWMIPKIFETGKKEFTFQITNLKFFQLLTFKRTLYCSHNAYT